MEQEALAPLKVKFTHLPKSKRFRELYKILSKSDGLKLTVKTGLIYPLVDADRILKELHDYVHTPEFKGDKKERLFISFVLLSNETNIAYEISRYSLMNNKYTIKDIVEEQLDTTYIDPEKYDNGKSDFKEDAKLLKERIEKGYEIKSNQISDNVSVTNKKPSAFNRFFSSRKNKDETLSEIENKEAIETGNNEDKEIEEMKVIEDLPNEENKIKENHIEDTNNDKEDKEDLKETSELTNEEDNIKQEVYTPKNNEDNKVVKNVEYAEEKKEEPPKQQTKKEKDMKNDGQEIIIPKLSYEKPEISLLTGNYVSKAVQEYLNEAEYERVLQKNKKIEDYNNDLNAYYLDLQKELEEKLSKHKSKKYPKEETLKKFKEDEITAIETNIKSFDKDLSSKNKEVIALKREQFDAELNELKERNKNKLEQLKKEIELEEKAFEDKENSNINSLLKEQEKDLSEKLANYTEALKSSSRERVENAHQELLEKYYFERDQYRHDLTRNMLESLKNKYNLYQKELSELTHDSYISKIKNDIKKIKENAERHHEKIEKEKSRQSIEKTRLKELELKDIDVRKLQEEKEHNISEQKRIEAENRERELQIKEKQQADDHVARMKELELKYMQSKQTEKEQPKFNRFLAGILSMLFALVLLILIGAYLMFNTAQGETYESLLNNQDYSSIAEHYPDKVDHLSEELYKKEDSQGLEQLNNETNNELANFRYQLMNNSKEDIITSYENISDKGKLKDAERLKVAQAYLDNNQFEEAKEINQTLNDREINKQLAEIEYYNQMKAELEEVIEKSKDKEEVKKAEKELKQVNIILGNK